MVACSWSLRHRWWDELMIMMFVCSLCLCSEERERGESGTYCYEASSWRILRGHLIKTMSMLVKLEWHFQWLAWLRSRKQQVGHHKGKPLFIHEMITYHRQGCLNPSTCCHWLGRWSGDERECRKCCVKWQTEWGNKITSFLLSFFEPTLPSYCYVTASCAGG